MGSLVSDDVKPPPVSEKEPEAAPAKTEKKKGGFSWFSGKELKAVSDLESVRLWRWWGQAAPASLTTR